MAQGIPIYEYPDFIMSIWLKSTGAKVSNCGVQTRPGVRVKAVRARETVVHLIDDPHVQFTSWSRFFSFFSTPGNFPVTLSLFLLAPYFANRLQIFFYL